MSINNLWVHNPDRLPHFLDKLRSSRYVRIFTIKIMREENIPLDDFHRFWILFRELGFFDKKGVSTRRFHEFVDPYTSETALKDGIHQAYRELFFFEPEIDQMEKKKIGKCIDQLTNKRLEPRDLEAITDTFITLNNYSRLSRKIQPDDENFRFRENILFDIISKYRDRPSKK